MKTLTSAVLCAGIVGAGIVPASAAPTPTPAPVPGEVTKADVKKAVKALPGYIKDARKKTGVPGLAVAIVYKNKVIYRNGFGVRSTRSNQKVTPKTVFQMASVSKPVGATAVAAAISDGVVKWSTPMSEIDPSFALQDPWVTKHVTVGDLYAHRSGLPGSSGNELEDFGFDRKTIIERLRYEPLQPFRITYDYSNFGLTAAAEAVSKKAGSTWNELAKGKILKPLQMKDSTYSHAEFLQEANRASLHQKVNGKWLPYSTRNADAQAPAGGLSSTVNDMARWMRMEMNLGKFNGVRLVGRGAMREALSQQIRTTPASDVLEPSGGYGYGQDVMTDDTGRVQWLHSGAFSAGAATRVAMIPSLKLGIVVLTNTWPVGVPEAITKDFFDLVEHGAVREDYLAYYQAMLAPLTTPTTTVFGEKKPSKPTPSKPLSTFVGTYANDYVGQAEVIEQSGHLMLKLGPKLESTRRLYHWNRDIFYYDAPDMPPGFYAGVRFTTTDKGTLELEEVGNGTGVLERVLTTP